jgi:hypothetical protein
MNHKIKCPALASKQGTLEIKQKYNNTVSSQRKRLFAALRERKGKGISVFYSREILGIIHPSARVLELRKAGHEIITDWCFEPDSNNVIHRIGLFKLIKEVAHVA